MGDRSIQHLIDKILGRNKGNKEQIKKDEKEILENLVKCKSIYVLLSKDTTREQFKEGSAPIYCKMNPNGIPSYWVFSSKEIAENCAKSYGLMIENEPLIMEVHIQAMVQLVYQGIFKGILDLVIDDSANFLVAKGKDFVNAIFTADGERKLIPESDYAFIEMYNFLKFGNKKVYLIANESSNFEKIFNHDFKLDIRDDSIRIFTDKAKAEEYAKENLNSEFYAVESDYIQFNDAMAKVFEDNKDYKVIINKGHNTYENEFRRICAIAGKMR